jgi:hypothetical protein
MTSIIKVDTLQTSSGTTVLTTDSSGRVKMPNQVIFQGVSETIVSTKYTNYTADAPSDTYTLSLTNIGGLLNVGGHFNATTGVFTVPISGIYEFHVGFSSKNNNTNRKIGVVLVNSASIGEAFESSDPYADGSRTFFANLSANDTVQLGTDGEAFNVCSFSGRLIQ